MLKARLETIENFKLPLPKRLEVLNNDPDNCKAYFEKGIFFHNAKPEKEFIDQRDENYTAFQTGLIDYEPPENEFFSIRTQSFLTDERRKIKKFRSQGKPISDNMLTYEKFLKKNQERYRIIDKMIFQFGPPPLSTDFKSLIEEKIKNLNIDLFRKDEQLAELIWKADRIQLRNLILFRENEELPPEEKNQLKRIFPFDHYKNSTYTEDKKYKNLVKQWFLHTLESKRQWWGFKELPPVYQYLWEQGESWSPDPIPVYHGLFSDKTTEFSYTAPQIKYPTHIFKDERAYQLFHTLAQELKSHTSLSFFYRKMAEGENPPLILVRDVMFREWFNSMDYQCKLSKSTRTLQESTNEERELIYKMAQKNNDNQ